MLVMITKVWDQVWCFWCQCESVLAILVMITKVWLCAGDDNESMELSRMRRQSHALGGVEGASSTPTVTELTYRRAHVSLSLHILELTYRWADISPSSHIAEITYRGTHISQSILHILSFTRISCGSHSMLLTHRETRFGIWKKIYMIWWRSKHQAEILRKDEKVP